MLQRFKHTQIVDKDNVTDSELGNLGVHNNIFLTRNLDQVIVEAIPSKPAALVTQGKHCTNVSDTSVTLSGSAGQRNIYAIAEADGTFSLEAVDNSTTPTSGAKYIGSVEWDGSAVSLVKSSLSSYLLKEKQNPLQAGQTLFALREFSYEPGREELLVFVNGKLQIVGVGYEETSQTSVTFLTSSLVTADTIYFVKIRNHAIFKFVTPAEIIQLVTDTSDISSLSLTAFDSGFGDVIESGDLLNMPTAQNQQLKTDNSSLIDSSLAINAMGEAEVLETSDLLSLPSEVAQDTATNTSSLPSLTLDGFVGDDDEGSTPPTPPTPPDSQFVANTSSIPSSSLSSFDGAQGDVIEASDLLNEPSVVAQEELTNTSSLPSESLTGIDSGLGEVIDSSDLVNLPTEQDQMLTNNTSSLPSLTLPSY